MAKKLMIVDDRALSRHLVRQAAATPQDTVLEFASADEAEKAVGTFKPDCVMLGVNLPPPGVFPLIKRIRKIYPEVRVVAVSSFAEPELQQAANDAGASSFVTMENLSELFVLAAPERLAMKSAARRPAGRKLK